MTEYEMNNGVTLNNESARQLLANRYRIVRQLGQGGMGSVWLAEDTQLDDKLFAIKMLPSILVSDKRAYQQLKAEALVAMKLVHPNIVQIRAFEDNNNNPFLVMDYIEGQTLGDYLGDGGTGRASRGEESEDRSRGLGRASVLASRSQGSGVREEEVVRLLKPVAEALNYAHCEGDGVVHRDIKPANIMIRKDGRPFIMDFGIAREIQETMTRVTGKMSSGTLMYMSPEQLHGLEPKKSQDIYSFAAMVYECLTGKPPFYRGKIEYQIDHDEPKPLSEDFAIASSVMAGLAKNPEDRPKSCVAVLEGDYGKREKEQESGVSSQELGVRSQELAVGRQESGGNDPDEGRFAKSLDACERREGERPREPRRKFFVKIAAIGLLALGLIGGLCFLLGKNDKFEVIEDGMVQLWEGGPYWAAKNIGAEKPEDPGYYFWWGDTIGYKREGYKCVASDGSDSNFSFDSDKVPTCGKSISDLEREGWIEKKDGTYVLTSMHDAARAHWGGNWRMPTKKEIDDLNEKCDWTWTTRNGVNGYIVRGRGNYASKSIFLPAAGLCSGTSYYAGGGNYWSSVPGSDNYAWDLYFGPSYHYTKDYFYGYRGGGLSVRPLQGFTK